MTTRPGPQLVLAEQFRTVMSHVATPVAVVATEVDAMPYGTTVSAFMSLSAEPPTILVSLGNDSALLAKLSRGVVAGINVLSAGQADLATRFARKDKTDVLTDWEIHHGAPQLPGIHAFFAVTVTKLVVVADHTLVIGAVTAANSTPNEPLVYWQRTYGTHRGA